MKNKFSSNNNSDAEQLEPMVSNPAEYKEIMIRDMSFPSSEVFIATNHKEDGSLHKKFYHIKKTLFRRSNWLIMYKIEREDGIIHDVFYKKNGDKDFEQFFDADYKIEKEITYEDDGEIYELYYNQNGAIERAFIRGASKKRDFITQEQLFEDGKLTKAITVSVRDGKQETEEKFMRPDGSEERFVVYDADGDKDSEKLFYEDGSAQKLYLYYKDGTLSQENFLRKGKLFYDGGSERMVGYREDGTKDLEYWYRDHGLANRDREMYYQEDGKTPKEEYIYGKDDVIDKKIFYRKDGSKETEQLLNEDETIKKEILYNPDGSERQ